MLSGLRIGLLLLGVLLLLATLPPLIPRIFGARMPAFGQRLLRGALGIAGAALIVSVLASYAGAPTRPAPSAASAPPGTAPAPVGANAAPADLVAAASDALEDCALAEAPAVPDGSKASLSQMTAAKSAFKAYDDATVRYVKCVDAAVDRISTRFAGVASSAELDRLKSFGISAHNSAIDKEQAVADQFNAQVRAYNARHAGQPPPRPPHA